MKLLKSLLATSIVAGSVGLMVMSASAYAHEQEYHHRAHQIKRMLRGLDLTVEQRQDIKQIMRQTKEDVKLYREDAKLARQDIKSLVQQGSWDAQAAEDAIDASAELKAKMGLQRAETKHQIWSLLTAEQQEKWVNRMEKRASKEFREFNPERQERFFERLDFTEEQIAEATQIREQKQQSAAELREKRKAFKQAEFEIITADEFSEEAWLALHAQYADDFKQGQLIALETRNQMFNLMTPEQRDKAKSMKKRKGKRRHKREQV